MTSNHNETDCLRPHVEPSYDLKRYELNQLSWRVRWYFWYPPSVCQPVVDYRDRYPTHRIPTTQPLMPDNHRLRYSLQAGVCILPILLYPQKSTLLHLRYHRTRYLKVLGSTPVGTYRRLLNHSAFPRMYRLCGLIIQGLRQQTVHLLQ